MNAFVLIGFLLCLGAEPKGAPTPQEEKLFTDGLRALQGGDARGAEKLWKQGYAVRQDPAFLVRIGEAQEKAGAPPEAAESYRRYLREAPDAADRAEIEGRLARLNPGIVPPRPPPAGDGPAPPPGETPLPSAPPPAPAPSAPVPVTPAVDAETHPARRSSGDEPSGWNAINTTAWIATGATTLLLGTAGFFAASAASKKDDVNRLVTFRDPMTGQPLPYDKVAAQYESATADGRHDDRVAKLALLCAAGTAAVATTFFIIDGVRAGDGGVAVAPDARGLAVLGSWRWRF